MEAISGSDEAIKHELQQKFVSDEVMKCLTLASILKR
jgi:hypothetical protein